jgi:hypothetical protein
MLCRLPYFIITLCLVNADHMSRNASVPYLLDGLRIMMRVDGELACRRLVLSSVRRIVCAASHLEVVRVTRRVGAGCVRSCEKCEFKVCK